jgi:hypothetical protein
LHTIAILSFVCAAPAPLQTHSQPDETQHPAPASQETEVESGSTLLDPEDHWFDVSRFLEHPAGFLPVIVPITEPAIGYGAFGAAAFLDPREEAGAEGWARPNITAVGGMWTRTQPRFRRRALTDGRRHRRSWSPAARSTDLRWRTAIRCARTTRCGTASTSRLFGGPRATRRIRLRLRALRLGQDPGRFLDRRPASERRSRRRRRDVRGSDVRPALRLADNMFTPTRGTLSGTTVSIFDEAFGPRRL